MKNQLDRKNKKLKEDKGIAITISVPQLKKMSKEMKTVNGLTVHKGGFLPLIFAALRALEAFAGSASSIATSVINAKKKNQELEEQHIHNLAMEEYGKGLKKVKCAKNVKKKKKLHSVTLILINRVKKLNIKNFRGVFMIDELLNKPLDNECEIVNLDVSTNSCTHWVCYWKKANKYYFDSFGGNPPRQLIAYLGSNLFVTMIEFKISIKSLKRLHYPLEIEGHSLALVQFYTTYLKHNIISGRNKLYFVGQNDMESAFDIPVGQYSLKDLEKTIKTIFSVNVDSMDGKENDISFKLDKITNRVKVKCTLKLQFGKQGSIGKLLGFVENKSLKANVDHYGDTIPKFAQFETINIHCNIVNVQTNQVNEIIVEIKDEKGKLINFDLFEITVVLEMKPIHQIIRPVEPIDTPVQSDSPNNEYSNVSDCWEVAHDGTIQRRQQLKQVGHHEVMFQGIFKATPGPLAELPHMISILNVRESCKQVTHSGKKTTHKGELSYSVVRYSMSRGMYATFDASNNETVNGLGAADKGTWRPPSLMMPCGKNFPFPLKKIPIFLHACGDHLGSQPPALSIQCQGVGTLTTSVLAGAECHALSFLLGSIDLALYVLLKSRNMGSALPVNLYSALEQSHSGLYMHMTSDICRPDVLVWCETNITAKHQFVTDYTCTSGATSYIRETSTSAYVNPVGGHGRSVRRLSLDSLSRRAGEGVAVAECFPPKRTRFNPRLGHSGFLQVGIVLVHGFPRGSPLNIISGLLASAVCMTSERNETVVVSIPQSKDVGEQEAVLSPGCMKESSLERVFFKLRQLE
ncbi:hypothetical protein PR048_008136, partial [Dryococelus australis]